MNHQRTSNQMGKTVFTAEEVAERLGLTVDTIREHLRSGKLPATKPGKSYIITRADLAAYLGGKERVDSLFGER